MKKRLIKIQDWVDDCILAEDVYTENMALLVTENTRLNQYILDKMKQAGIDSFHIYDDKEHTNNTEEAYNNFIKGYSNNVDTVKHLLNDLATGKTLEHEIISSVSETLYKEINEKNNIIKCLSSIKNCDQYTYNHSINVALYSMLIAKWINLPEEKLKEVIKAGVLHDIGKSQIDPEILNKKGTLSDKEFEIIKKHPVYGYNIAKKDGNISNEILRAILMHHERDDGSGYPFGAKGTNLNIHSKIVAIADVYDALTSERAYKSRITPFETFRIIERTGLGKFDTKILMTFLSNISSYYIGMDVKMSSGEIGKVIYVLPHNLSKPIVKIDNKYYDTSVEDISILELVG